MTKPLVIGYYTVNTPYEEEAELLKLSLQTHGYEHDLRPVENLGTWQKNTQLKAEIVRHFLSKYPGRPLLYLDVDAIMIQKPVLLDELDADIAAVHFCDTSELLSGTVYFGGTEKCIEVVDRWMVLNAKYPKLLPDGRKAWDQRTLEMAIRETESVNFVELPEEYTWIVELTEKRKPGLVPVIQHTRGAYRWKKKIDRGQFGQA